MKRISAVAQVRRPTTRWTGARVAINLIVGIDVVHNRRARSIRSFGGANAHLQEC